MIDIGCTIESREPRAESREPRAESREPRAESREPRAESRVVVHGEARRLDRPRPHGRPSSRRGTVPFYLGEATGRGLWLAPSNIRAA